MDLKAYLNANGLSIAQAAKIMNMDRTTVSKIASGDYPNYEDRATHIIRQLQEEGFTAEPREGKLYVDDTAMVATSNVTRFKNLCDDLASPDNSLSSSIGMVLGSVGRGKTHTTLWYVTQKSNVARVQFMEGFTLVKLLKEIAFELSGMKPNNFERCLAVIEEASAIVRRLVIIDEADKMPVRYIEMLRGLNERCRLPFVLVGEEALKAKIDGVPRLKSRIRKPIVLYQPVDVVDVKTFYKVSVGIDVSVEVAAKLCKKANGDFRTVVNDAMALVKIMNASDIAEVTGDMLQKIS